MSKSIPAKQFWLRLKTVHSLLSDTALLAAAGLAVAVSENFCETSPEDEAVMVIGPACPGVV